MEESGLDALYGEAPETFVAARNALAKTLVQAGDRDGAALVKALRKPSSTAWALNQLTRTRRADVDRLVAAGDELRQAQRDALEGGDPDRLREARRAHDEEVDRLASAAEGLLSDAGKPAGAAQRARLTTTLQSAAADDEARELLQRGRLVHDLEPPGFGFGDELTIAPSVSTPSPRPDRTPRPTRSRTTKPKPEPDPGHARVTAGQEARRLSTAAGRAEARAQRLSHDAEQAERTAVELRRRAEEALAAAIEARQAADAASRRGDAAGPVP
jgi:hypothetical protein